MPKQTIAQGANARFFHEVETRAAPERIWFLWTTPQTWRLWDQGLADAEFSGPFVVGATGRIVPKSGPKTRFRVTALQELRFYAFETSLPLARLVVERSIISRDPTLIRHDVSFKGAFGAVWASLFGPDFRKALPPTMDELVRLAGEGELE